MADDTAQAQSSKSQFTSMPVPSACSTATGSPFQTRLFQQSPVPAFGIEHDGDTKAPSDPQIWEHFPASFRTGRFEEHVHAINSGSISRFLEVEFSLTRLEAIDSKLWRVGYPRPPRPLTKQMQLGRMIVPANSLDMHLLWAKGKIYVKPLPRFLLEPEFWTTQLAQDNNPQAPNQSKVRAAALGLLYTYACIIAHPVNLKLALEYNLIPRDAGREPSWRVWRMLAVEILQWDKSNEVHRRFERGELRLHRLNWIYLFKDIPTFQLYFNPWQDYTEFITANLSWIAAATIYVAIVLTAMQVGLSTKALQDNDIFHAACYGFAVFAIVSPIGAICVVIFMLVVAVIPNWMAAKSAQRKRAALNSVATFY